MNLKWVASQATAGEIRMVLPPLLRRTGAGPLRKYCRNADSSALDIEEASAFTSCFLAPWRLRKSPTAAKTTRFSTVQLSNEFGSAVSSRRTRCRLESTQWLLFNLKASKK